MGLMNRVRGLGRQAQVLASSVLFRVCLAVMALATFAPSAWATDPPPFELPDTGVNLTEIIAAMALVLGTAIAAVIAAYAAFRVLKIALAWFSRIGG